MSTEVNAQINLLEVTQTYWNSFEPLKQLVYLFIKGFKIKIVFHKILLS